MGSSITEGEPSEEVCEPVQGDRGVEPVKHNRGFEPVERDRGAERVEGGGEYLLSSKLVIPEKL